MEYIEHASFIEIYWSLVSLSHLMTFTIFWFLKAHNILTLCRCQWIVLKWVKSVIVCTLYIFHLSGLFTQDTVSCVIHIRHFNTKIECFLSLHNCSMPATVRIRIYSLGLNEPFVNKKSLRIYLASNLAAMKTVFETPYHVETIGLFIKPYSWNWASFDHELMS